MHWTIFVIFTLIFLLTETKTNRLVKDSLTTLVNGFLLLNFIIKFLVKFHGKIVVVILKLNFNSLFITKSIDVNFRNHYIETLHVMFSRLTAMANVINNVLSMTNLTYIHPSTSWPDVNEHNLFAIQAIKFVSILNHRMHYYNCIENGKRIINNFRK